MGVKGRLGFLWGGAWLDPLVTHPSTQLTPNRSTSTIHTHTQVLHGRKRWFLYAPSSDPVPGFHPNMSSLTWQTQVLPALVEAGEESAYVISCVEIRLFSVCGNGYVWLVCVCVYAVLTASRAFHG